MGDGSWGREGRDFFNVGLTDFSHYVQGNVLVLIAPTTFPSFSHQIIE